MIDEKDIKNRHQYLVFIKGEPWLAYGCVYNDNHGNTKIFFELPLTYGTYKFSDLDFVAVDFGFEGTNLCIFEIKNKFPEYFI